MKKWRRLLKMECSKAIKNKFFLISLCVGLLLALISGISGVYAYFQTKKELMVMGGNPMIQSNGLYKWWLVPDGASLGNTLFFTLLPLLACIPYGWSQCIEQKSGYTKNVVVKAGKQQYYLAKYIASFLAGGVVVVIPLMVNFLLVACFIPAIKPSVMYWMYYGIARGSMWSQIFYSHPLIFVFLCMVLNFLFAGVFSTLSYGLSVYMKNWIAVVLLPVLAMFALDYGRIMFGRYLIAPAQFLHPVFVMADVNGWIVLAEWILFFLFSFGSIVRSGVKHEIY